MTQNFGFKALIWAGMPSSKLTYGAPTQGITRRLQADMN